MSAALSNATKIDAEFEDGPEPFLKCAGGKRAITSELLRYVPEVITGRYFEPFLGGGALFFAIMSERARMSNVDRPGDTFLNDLNREFLNCYEVVRDDLDALVSVLQHGTLYKNTRQCFYSVRQMRPNFDTKEWRVIAAARTLYLNRVCYNGLFRVNLSGGFNAPFGKYKNPKICDVDKLNRARDALRAANVVFGTQDFEAYVDLFNPRPNDVIYCDPPYWPIDATANFTSYTSKGFGPADQKRLAEAARRWASAGATVILSNADVPPIRRLYRKHFSFRRIQVRRAINSRADRRDAVGELIIVSRPGGRA